MNSSACARGADALALTAPGAGAASLTAIEARRFDEQDEDGERVDEESAGLGIQILAADIEDPQQDGGDKRALEAAKPAHRHDDEKEYQVEDGKARREPESLNREPAAERAQAASQRKGEGKQPIDIDADRLRHTTIIDGGTNLGTDIGPLEAVPEHGNQHGTNQDDESAVGRDRAHTDIDLPGEKAWKGHGLRARPIEIRVGGDRHECEADRKQHLVELAGLVQARIKRALEQDADCAYRDES